MLRRGLVLVLALTAWLAFAGSITRLILKDGSYQSVTKYEVKGNRVRYYSAERSQWEEVPSEMVDWPATQNYEKKEQAKAAGAAAEEAKRKQAEAEQDAIDAKDARTPEVAPNLRLPGTGGVFALDEYQNSPQLVPLGENSTQSSQHVAKYLLLHKYDPLVSRKQTIELPGGHARVQLHTPIPTIYLNINTDSDADADADAKYDPTQRRESSDAYRFKFVRLGEKGKVRILATVLSSDVTVDQEEEKFIPTLGLLTPGSIWIKIQPKEDLKPGEYAIVQMLGDDRMNSVVWDFGVNPSAPENVSVATGEKKPQPESDTSKRMKD